jgi:hypothetical protein
VAKSPLSIRLLSNELLIGAYEQAVSLQLERAFIQLVKEELIRRSIPVPQPDTHAGPKLQPGKQKLGC